LQLNAPVNDQNEIEWCFVTFTRGGHTVAIASQHETGAAPMALFGFVVTSSGGFDTKDLREAKALLEALA